ncbi:hypothetical protein B0J11DRAFT_426112 [Dendryphion nanum]|uniref:tRNA-splicing endonuclease subunit Sen2 n=1 Tax=Dendryphion nanum TaxID=256645 RepID=A0A9P9EBB4_9PLEO|nr:hypothetical protein B0J11DRAFT_426112 [Dendryphion nanum]
MPVPLAGQSSNLLPSEDTTASTQPNKSTKPTASRYRGPRPNYHKIHAQPLPLGVHPLPAFIPHNPLSIVRIAIALISHSLWPPTSHQSVHVAHFSPETQSIHVTDPKSIRALWEQGFFGAGSLSRSEPRWLDLEKRKRGLQATITSEENTRFNRNERKIWKLDRARKEREAREAQLRLERGMDTAIPVGQNANTDTTAEHNLTPTNPEIVQSEPINLVHPITVKQQPSEDRTAANASIEIRDQEHLQLMFEEAFFLAYVLGALDIINGDSYLTSQNLFRTLCAYSSFPYPEQAKQTGPADVSRSFNIAPDNDFLLRYVVFHHFRSLGWVVRDGVKFASDYILYDRGPAFTHAEFGVMIIPSFSHPYWSDTPERKEKCDKKASRDWWWFHRANRVQTQVYKTLVLVYVEVPPPWDAEHATSGSELDIGKILKSYNVREVVIRRWTPNRNRN